MSYFHGVVSYFFSIFLVYFSLNASSFEEDTWDISSPMSGRVERVFVTPGTFVERGTPLFVSEAMKMFMTVTAQHAGYVYAVHINAGDMVSTSQNLISFQRELIHQSPQRGDSQSVISILGNEACLETPQDLPVNVVEERPVECSEDAQLCGAQASTAIQELFVRRSPLLNDLSCNALAEETGHNFESDDTFLSIQDGDGQDPPTPLGVSHTYSSKSIPHMQISAVTASASQHFLDNIAPYKFAHERHSEFSPMFQGHLPLNMIFHKMDTKSTWPFLEDINLAFKVETASLMIKNSIESFFSSHNYFRKIPVYQILSKTFSQRLVLSENDFYQEALNILKTSWSSLWFLSSQPLGIACIILAILLSFLPSPQQGFAHFIQNQTAYARQLRMPEKNYLRVKN